jgi:thioredoxin-like negative regulator of GroEL
MHVCLLGSRITSFFPPAGGRKRPIRFENAQPGHPNLVTTQTRVRETRPASRLPALLFVRSPQCGASRRMESLVAWVKVTQKKRLRVIDVDADRNPALTRELEVTVIPSLVLIKNHRVVARLEGRATGRQIDDLIRPHLAA